MKHLLYISLALFLFLTSGCKEDNQPYVGYIIVDRALLEADGGSVTITAETDISDPIQMEVADGSDWLSLSSNGKEITVTAKEANPTSDVRVATVNVRAGYRTTSFFVLQKYAGQQYLEYDWTRWNATGSDVQPGDGGGYESLFKYGNTTFWHSQYSPALPVALPHTLVIDMQKELEVYRLHIGRRGTAAGVYYGNVKKVEIYASSDDITYSQVEGFTFEFPWTAPDGTIVAGPNNALIPPYQEVILSSPVTARYFKLVITETNNTTGACQVAYFKALNKISE